MVLVSGGLDSATTLAFASNRGFQCYALSFDYGQRHKYELKAAMALAEQFGVCEHKTISLNLGAIGGSALTDNTIAVPQTPTVGIPVTYVPARNSVFLSIALGWSEVLGSLDIFIGVNAVDYSGYPDCRPEFIAAFEKMANLATKVGVEGNHFRIHTPLIDKSKADIIKMGTALGVDFSKTVSCYRPSETGQACGRCDSCRLRLAGFTEAGIPDTTRYQCSDE